MSERADHVTAIRARPDCDTTRLVYADWLDEQPHPLDLDRATAEFIRLTCGPGNRTNRRKAEAGTWLWCNWRRLVPNLLREHTDTAAGAVGVAVDYVCATTVVVWPRLCLPLTAPYRASSRPRHQFARVQLRFARGFLDVWSCRAEWRAMLEGVLAVDQPLAVPRGKGKVAA